MNWLTQKKLNIKPNQKCLSWITFTIRKSLKLHLNCIRFSSQDTNDIDIHEIKWNYINFVQILFDQIAINLMILKYIESTWN